MLSRAFVLVCFFFPVPNPLPSKRPQASLLLILGGGQLPHEEEEENATGRHAQSGFEENNPWYKFFSMEI